MRKALLLLFVSLCPELLCADSESRSLKDFQIGMNCHQFYPENIPLLRDLGIASSRVDLVWKEVSDANGELIPSASTFQRIQNAPLSFSNTLGILCYGHPRFQGGGRPTQEISIKRYTDFCLSTVNHLKQYTRFFEIWNEWNVVGMGDTPRHEGHGTPATYFNLLQKTYVYLKALHPDLFLLGGAMGGIGDYKDQDFYKTLLSFGFLDFCDGISIHPYFYGEQDLSRRLPEIAIPSRINKIGEWLSKYPTESHKPLYVTEIGWPTLDTPEGVTYAEQAKWLTRSLFIFACYPNVKGVWIYELRDGKKDPSDREANFGLVCWDGKPKPAYDCMRDTISLLSKHQAIRQLKLFDKDLAAVVLSTKAGKKSVAVWVIYPEKTYQIRIKQNSRTDTPKTIGRLQYPDGPLPVDPDGWFTVDDHPVLVTGVDEDFELLHKKQ